MNRISTRLIVSFLIVALLPTIPLSLVVRDLLERRFGPAIADPLDLAQNEVIRIVEERDDSTGVGKAFLALYDTVAAMDEFTPDHVDMKDPDQVAIYKTVRIIENQVIYAHGYLST